MNFNIDKLKNINEETPFFVFNDSALKANFYEFKNSFPLETEICYAMKANSEPEVLRILISEGASFEVASKYELGILKALNVPSEKILYGTAVKPESHIADFVEYGVTRFAFDSLEELLKIKKFSSNAKVYVRVLVDDRSDSVFKMSEKFGISIDEGLDLLIKSKELGLQQYGLSFNVGSQARNAEAWSRGLKEIIGCIDKLDQKGIRIEAINIGGGFPYQYQDNGEFPTLDEITKQMEGLMTAAPYPIKFIVEPGRALVANTFCLIATVIAKSKRNSGHWLYIDAGVYNALLESMAWQGTTRYRMEALENHSTREKTNFILTGPTGDNLDVIHQEAFLPSDMRAGEKIVIYDVGAYTFPLITQFNGFPKPKIIS